MIMAEQQHSGATPPQTPAGFPPEAFDYTLLPDVDTDFLAQADIEAFIQALAAPDLLASPEDASSIRIESPTTVSSLDVTKRASTSWDLIDGGSAAAAGPNETGFDSQATRSQSAAAASDVSAPGPADQQPISPLASGSSGARPGCASKMFITAANDWAPVHEKVSRTGSGGGRRHREREQREQRERERVREQDKREQGRRPARRARNATASVLGRRTKDETREGYLYGLLKWPFLAIVGCWILGLAVAYLATRLYVWLYENFVAWRGTRERLRRAMRATSSYREWVAAARQLDRFLGNDRWKEENEFAYYDSKTVRRVWHEIRRCRAKAEAVEAATAGKSNGAAAAGKEEKAVEELRALIAACVKNNFAGVENPRLYSQTYYGTKNLVQNFVDEVDQSLRFLLRTNQLSLEEKRAMFKGLHANYGRTALCLSGGASFAYYHFGVVKALLEEDLLPDVITGTSGGALVAALVATRTNDELKKLLVPALAHRINACGEPITVWFWRWWKTGARFDSIDWAKKCSWWSRGSMTFREAYERTGRILNVSCVPSDPHSPTILCNYLTSPDCVIWSAVLASAAVPGILNPVVLMMKTHGGQLVPYSFGHKWKDGSLRTDIPVKALNLHFNVNFTIVSQVNPHINLFFFSSRGSVGSPVTHRKGRGWRGGYLGSATEQYIKLDLNKWLRVLRHLELLPRPLGQDWSQLWLQEFGGTITIWPKTAAADFWHILDDPDPARLAGMMHEGRQSVFPKLKFVANRLRVERLVEQGRNETRPFLRRGSIETIISEEDLRNLLRGHGPSATETEDDDYDDDDDESTDAEVEGRRRRVVDGNEQVISDGEDDLAMAASRMKED